LFAEHAVGGIIGLLANGVFGTKDVANLDGVTHIEGGWLDHNWKQLYKQFAYICATCAYNFVVTALICKLLDLIPGMGLRASADAEELGMDDDQIGEFASDYVELRRNYWDAPQTSSEQVTKLEDPSVTNGTHIYAAGDRHGKPDHEAHEKTADTANVTEKGSETTPSEIS